MANQQAKVVTQGHESPYTPVFRCLAWPRMPMMPQARWCQAQKGSAPCGNQCLPKLTALSPACKQEVPESITWNVMNKS
eukprot:1161368-Pelagomonas_calceolata.AAC.5